MFPISHISSSIQTFQHLHGYLRKQSLDCLLLVVLNDHYFDVDRKWTILRNIVKVVMP